MVYSIDLSIIGVCNIADSYIADFDIADFISDFDIENEIFCFRAKFLFRLICLSKYYFVVSKMETNYECVLSHQAISTSQIASFLEIFVWMGVNILFQPIRYHSLKAQIENSFIELNEMPISSLFQVHPMSELYQLIECMAMMILTNFVVSVYPIIKMWSLLHVVITVVAQHALHQYQYARSVGLLFKQLSPVIKSIHQYNYFLYACVHTHAYMSKYLRTLI